MHEPPRDAHACKSVHHHIAHAVSVHVLVFKPYDKNNLWMGNISVIYHKLYQQQRPQVTRITPLASHLIHAWFIDVTNFVSLSFHFRLSVNRVRASGEVTDSYPCDLRDNKESLVTTSHMRYNLNTFAEPASTMYFPLSNRPMDNVFPAYNQVSFSKSLTGMSWTTFEWLWL